jgi:hypothetical protein
MIPNVKQKSGVLGKGISAIMSFVNSVMKRSASFEAAELKGFREATRDFRYLLNRGYSRRASLELVGNRYQLSSDHRHLLHRGVFSDADSKSRLKKIVSLKGVRTQNLAIDGHNVLITIEAGLGGRPLILGDDGFVRDISGLSGNFKVAETTEKALLLIINAIKKIKPRQTLFLLDAPISMSGKLAQEIRVRLKREDLPGDAMAVKVPEKILLGFPGVVATSDTAIIDTSERVLDLAASVLRRKVKLTQSRCQKKS